MRVLSQLVVALAVAANGAGAKPVGQDASNSQGTPRKPLVSTKILSSTAELLAEICGTAYSKLAAPIVAAHGDKVSAVVSENFNMALKKAGIEKVFAMQSENAKTSLATLRRVGGEKLALVHAELNLKLAALVERFDKAMPDFAGAIPNTFGDAVVFSVYMAAVIYLLIRIALFALRTALSVFCCVCCCGCCRRSGKLATTSKKAKSVAAKGVAAKGAAAKGQAAAAAPNGNAATAVGKKTKKKA